MSVESFDPGAETPELDSDTLAELLEAADALESPDFGLEAARVRALTAIARQDEGSDWKAAAGSIESAPLIALVKLFTLAERLPGWEAGARSPVIPLVAELRKRDEYPADLTVWIKSHTDNRFLPYGSLMDRL